MIKNILEKVIWGCITIIFIFVWNLGTTNNFQSEEINKIRSEHNSYMQLVDLQIKSLTQNQSTLQLQINKLQESREKLSDYYVTRIEFNRIVDSQNELLNKMDKNIEKITDKIYE